MFMIMVAQDLQIHLEALMREIRFPQNHARRKIPMIKMKRMVRNIIMETMMTIL